MPRIRAHVTLRPDPQMPETIERATARAGRYLTFYLGDEEYGVQILKVQEIIGMQPITRVPRTPAFMHGVINLRGKVIPIIDLRARFAMTSADDALAALALGARAAAAALRCIIVVQVTDLARHRAGDTRALHMGLVVDRVSEVTAIGADDIEDAPTFGDAARTQYLLGLGKSKTTDGGRVKLLLDIDRVLVADEMAAIAELPQADA